MTENEKNQPKKLIFKTLSEGKKFNRIPVPVGILLLVILALLLNFIRQKQILFPWATSQLKPQEVKTSNITDRSFVVSWITNGLTTGGVKLRGELVYRDIRDSQTGQQGKHYTHYVLIDHQLEAKTQYKFSIISGGIEFQNEQFIVNTAQLPSGVLPQANLAFGQVKDERGVAVPGAIVYFEIPGISLLSSLTTSQGNWVIPLSVAFDAQLTELAQIPDDKTGETIRVEGGPLGKSVVLNLVGNNRPVPAITLGQNHDFREILPNHEEEQTKESLFDNTFSLTPVPVDFEIKNPNEGETINTLRPEIFGVGPAGGKVEIIVESEKSFRTSLEIGQDQEWHWAVPDNLEPGEHTLTVNYISPTGEIKKIVRKFVVMAAEGDTSPAFISSPSALLTPTVLPSPTLTPTPTATPTISPRETMPSTESGVPTSGFGNLQILFILGGLFLLITGYYLFCPCEYFCSPAPQRWAKPNRRRQLYKDEEKKTPNS